MIEDDEFHPDPRHAAVYADRASHIASLKACREGLTRLTSRKEPLLPGEVAQADALRVRITELVEQIEQDKEDDSV